MSGSKVPAVIVLAVGFLQLGMAVLFGVLAQSMPIVRGGFIRSSCSSA
jgi:hypothetical protein